jgi:hypothetical protein
MNSNFTKDCLQINLGRNSDNTISVEVSSDYAYSSRKSQLYANSDKLRNEVEQFWKSIKTKKLLSMRVGFDEIDWYDDEVDVYQTPIIRIERGLKRAKLSERNHGSVPKDWSIDARFKFDDTTTNTPILEVLEKLLVHKFPTQAKIKIIKDLKPFLRKEVKSVNYYNNQSDDE